MDLFESTSISDVAKKYKKISEQMIFKKTGYLPGISRQDIRTLSLLQNSSNRENIIITLTYEKKYVRAASVLSFKLAGFFILLP